MKLKPGLDAFYANLVRKWSRSVLQLPRPTWGDEAETELGSLSLTYLHVPFTLSLYLMLFTVFTLSVLLDVCLSHS